MQQQYNEGDLKKGPEALPSNWSKEHEKMASLTPTQRQDVREKTNISVALRKRGKQQVQHLTYCGPAEGNWALAKNMALEYISKNISEGRSFSSTSSYPGAPPGLESMHDSVGFSQMPPGVGKKDRKRKQGVANQPVLTPNTMPAPGLLEQQQQMNHMMAQQVRLQQQQLQQQLMQQQIMQQWAAQSSMMQLSMLQPQPVPHFNSCWGGGVPEVPAADSDDNDGSSSGSDTEVVPQPPPPKQKPKTRKRHGTSRGSAPQIKQEDRQDAVGKKGDVENISDDGDRLEDNLHPTTRASAASLTPMSKRMPRPKTTHRKQFGKVRIFSVGWRAVGARWHEDFQELVFGDAANSVAKQIRFQRRSIPVSDILWLDCRPFLLRRELHVCWAHRRSHHDFDGGGKASCTRRCPRTGEVLSPPCRRTSRAATFGFCMHFRDPPGHCCGSSHHGSAEEGRLRHRCPYPPQQRNQ